MFCNFEIVCKKIKQNNYLKWAVRLAAALIVVFAVNCRIEIIEEIHPFKTALGCMLAQFAHSFSNFGLSDLLGVLAVFAIFKYIDKNSVKHSIGLYFLSLFFSLTYIICMSYSKFDDMTFISGNSYQKILSSFCTFGLSVLLYNVLRIIFYYLEAGRETVLKDTNFNVNSLEYDEKHLWEKSAIVIFLCWLPWMLMDYPGTFCRDSIDQLKQFFGYIEWSTHQPPFSTVLIGLCVAAGKILGMTNVGVFLYILLHAVSGALIFSYSIKIMRKLGASKNACFICTMFYAIVPIWGIYVQWIEKSLLYNELIVLFTVLLIEVIHDNEISFSKIIFLGVTGFFASLIRNNGIYVVVPTLIIMIFCVKKLNKIKLVCIAITVLVLYGLITKAIYPALNIKGGSIAEAFSIPFMQTARYVVSYENEITDDERQAIDGVLVYDELATRYDTTISDPVKMLYKDDSSKLPAYFNAYFKMFFKHPNIYVSAFINKNFAFLAPCYPVMEVGMDYGEEEWLADIGVRHIFTEMPIKFFDMIHLGITRWPVFKYFAMPGLYVWAIIIFLINSLKRKRLKDIVVLIPAILTILICFAGPSQDLRFILSVAGSMPVLAAYQMRIDI